LSLQKPVAVQVPATLLAKLQRAPLAPLQAVSTASGRMKSNVFFTSSRDTHEPSSAENSQLVKV
jgi:hypothetical protein